jgi:mannose-6-phosphate isomerase
MSTTFAPIALPCNQFDHFYRGGNRIGALRGGPGGPMRPEEWLASTTTRFGQAPQGLSRLPDGRLLVDAILADATGWLGAAHLERYGTSTEVLIKLLDLDQRLPVHLHPNRAFAGTHLGLVHGKTEAWYVLDAPAGAEVGVGFADAVSMAQLREWVDGEDADALLGSLQRKAVAPGDAMLVPAGLPHSVPSGVFVLELQEPTDLSILLEWQEFDVDGRADGHLGLGFEVVLDAVDRSAVSPADLDALTLTREQIEAAGLRSALPTRADPYFRIHRVDARSGPVTVDAGFGVLLVLEGAGVLSTDAGSIDLARGMAVLMAHASGPWAVQGDVVAMACRPPAPDAPTGAA